MYKEKGREASKLYRAHYHQADSKRFTVLVIVVSVLAIFFSICDYVQFGALEYVKVVFALRGLLIFSLCASLWLFCGRILPEKWNDVAMSSLICFSIYNYIMILEACAHYEIYYESLSFHLVNIIYAIVTILFLPVYKWQMHTFVVCSGIVFLTIVMSIKNTLTADTLVIFAFTFLVMILCAVFSVRVEIYRRGAFDRLQQEKSSKAEVEKILLMEREMRMLEEENLRSKMEIKLLNAQIKPHFIFNVIGTAAYVCKHDGELASKLLEQLAVYVRSSVQTNKEWVTIAEEMKVVEAYLYIQSIRMGNRMRYHTDISNIADAEMFLLPVFDIQTLVENAIIHGLKNCKRDGCVNISTALLDEECLLVAVADNGRGIDAGKQEEIIHKLKTAGRVTECPEGSIGLWNTNCRLVLMGNQGLTIKSRQGQGTEISFVLRKGG